MTTISFSLNKKEYTSMMNRYLLKRNNYWIWTLILWIFCSLLTFMMFPEYYDFLGIENILLFWIFIILYSFLFPLISYGRILHIYDKSIFFHHCMSICFDSDKITWETSEGIKNISYKTLFYISQTKTGLFLSLTREHTIPIPKSAISPEQWEQIYTYLRNNTKCTCKISQKHLFSQKK